MLGLKWPMEINTKSLVSVLLTRPRNMNVCLKTHTRNVQKFMQFLNCHFEDNTYLTGDKFTIADITALCTMDFNRVNQITITDEHPHLKRWYELGSSRPSAKA